MRMTASWSGSERTYRIQVCGAMFCARRRVPLGSLRRRVTAPSDAEAFEEKPVALFIVPPRAQASRRCETQATLRRQAAKLCYDPFRALREPDRRRPDEERLSRSEQRTGNKPKHDLTGKAPYRFESTSLQRRASNEPARVCGGSRASWGAAA